MTPLPASDRRQNALGSLWMVASMLAFSVEDVFLKLAGASLPVSHVMVAFGTLGMVIFALLGLSRGQSLAPPGVLNPCMTLRFWFEVFGRLFFTLSLVLTALSSTVAILQATPLVVVAGAALVFGERVSPRRWLAILIGLGCVMLILRPSAEGFSGLSFLAVLGMLGLALRDLATRAAPRSIPNAVLGFYSFASVVVAGLVYAVWEGAPPRIPDFADMPVLAGAALAGAAGYIALTGAMRTGDVSAVTPFRYARLICGAIVGVLAFGETVDGVEFLGTALIIGSGLFLLLGTQDAAVPLKRARQPEQQTWRQQQ